MVSHFSPIVTFHYAVSVYPSFSPPENGSPFLPRHHFNLTFTSLRANFPALAWRRGSIHIFSLNDSVPVMEELEEIRRPSEFLWHKVLLNCFTGMIAPRVPESKWWKMSQKSGQESSKCHRCGRRVVEDPHWPLEKAKAAWLRYWLPSSAVWRRATCSKTPVLPFFQTFVLSCSCTHPGKQEQLHPVLPQTGLAGQQAGETRVFIR